MKGILRKVKEKKSAFLPQHLRFLYLLVSMSAYMVKHNVSFLIFKGKGIEVFNDLVCVNAFSRTKPMIAVVSVNHAEDVDPLCLPACNVLPKS